MSDLSQSDVEPDDDEAIEMLPRGHTCRSCGSPVDSDDPYCTACGQPQATSSADDSPAPFDNQKHIRCENCGAEITTDPDRRSYVCPFCDSTYVVEFDPDTTGRQEPEFVIGFAVTREAAHQRFREWLGENAWFRPGDLTSARIEDKLEGLYLPFWSFSMLAQSDWSARIGEYWHRTETYTTTVNGKRVTRTRQVRETEWWPLAGKHHRYYRHYLVSGSRGLDQGDAERIKPFRLEALKRFRPRYLAGWIAEEYSIERAAALENCRREFADREHRNIATFLPGDTHAELDAQTQFSRISSDLILLPIYVLSYRYGDQVYRFLLNGQTGRAAGDKPVSRQRIVAAVVTALLLVGLFVLTIVLLNR